MKKPWIWIGIGGSIFAIGAIIMLVKKTSGGFIAGFPLLIAGSVVIWNGIKLFRPQIIDSRVGRLSPDERRYAGNIREKFKKRKTAAQKKLRKKRPRLKRKFATPPQAAISVNLKKMADQKKSAQSK